MPRRQRRDHHHVYVVLLSPQVWNEPAFRKANPDHDIVKPCVYVGMTGLDPDLRFDRHMAGVQANRFVLKYGVRLVPELYEVYNPCPTTRRATWRWNSASRCGRRGMPCGRPRMQPA